MRVNIRHLHTYFLFALLLIYCFASGCAPYKLKIHRDESVPTVNDIKVHTTGQHGKREAVRSSNKLSVTIVGFFNSGLLDSFQPKYIDYSALVNKIDVHNLLKNALGFKNIRLTAYGEIEKVIFSITDEDKNTLREFLYEILSVLNEVIKTNRYPADFRGVRYPSLIKYYGASTECNVEDPIYIVLGLETLLRKESDTNYVGSAIAVVKVLPNGNYVGMAVEGYDFRDFDNDIMVEKVTKLVKILY